MSDRFFFPLVLALAGALIALALAPSYGALPNGPVSVGDMNYNQVQVTGVQLNRIIAAGDVDLRLERDSSPVHIWMETTAETLSDDPLQGPHFELASDLEVQFSGFEIEVFVTAKPGERLGATQMMVNYSTGRDGESDWQIIDLKPDWDTFSFRYKVPVKTGQNGLDYLAIRPVTPDKTRTLLIRDFGFRRHQRWAVQEG